MIEDNFNSRKTAMLLKEENKVLDSDDIERFCSKIKVNYGDCWIWKAGKNEKGYGHFYLDGKTERAHRVVCLIMHDSWPGDKIVSHGCDNPSCVSPHHLLICDHKHNVADSIEKGRKERGVPYEPEKEVGKSKEIEIRRKYKDNDVTQEELSNIYDISKGLVWKIVHKKYRN